MSAHYLLSSCVEHAYNLKGKKGRIWFPVSIIFFWIPTEAKLFWNNPKLIQFVYILRQDDRSLDKEFCLIKTPGSNEQ